MGAAARQLFRELIDVPCGERERLLSLREVPYEIRAEVESLLRYDSGPGESITRRVSSVIEESLGRTSGPPSADCGPYRLLHLIGAGGMGAVYLAERRDGEIEHKVAIKLLRADNDRPAFRDRFLKERQILAYLNHPAIARLLDAGHTEDGRPFLVMEYVEGAAIDQYAAGLPLQDKLTLFLQVCEGVSHAHHHLVIHRDLKPSNILVDASGRPKLLDFGIAKLLDLSLDQTCTSERLLTPNYASPEQIRGELQTTATDVYSLGAVLYKLVTGQSPRDAVPWDSPAKPNPLEAAPAPPSRLNPALPRDLDHVVLKALRQEPAERYSSVDAFAGDVRALLECRPVQARSGHWLYRMRKFVKRHRTAAAAGAVAAAGLLTGLHIADRQTTLAQQRFGQVRQLASQMVALDQAVGGLDGSSRARREVAAMSKVYLETLSARARKDQDLAVEVSEAYSLLARVQGISFDAGEAEQAQALESLRKAEGFVQASLRHRPGDRKALLAAARISHHYMMMAEAKGRSQETVRHALRASAYLDRLTASAELSGGESERVSQIFNDISLAYKNVNRYQDAIFHARRAIEAARRSPDPRLRLSHSLSMLANLLRLTGDLEGALEAIREARVNLDSARFPSERVRRSSLALVLSREAMILGAASGISLNRGEEAIPLLRKAFDLLEAWTQDDPDDAWSRMLLATCGRSFGDILRARDAGAALAVYDHALLRVREVENNPEARRAEAELLAGSSYALRQMRRLEESGRRVDAALALLRENGDYPADKVSPHGAVHEALRALGDHLAAAGQPEKAAGAYGDLLARIHKSNPDPENNLAHAVAVSHIFGSMAAFHRQAGDRAAAGSFAERRAGLWRRWDSRLPGNPVVRRQLAWARSCQNLR